MAVENGKIVIAVFHDSDSEKMLGVLRKQGVDVSKCYVCGAAVEKAERDPYCFREKLLGFFRRQKFYDWNISGISAKGVICDEGPCFSEALTTQRDEFIMR
ncbi:hypothetical protein ES705_50014 [subsurface metagenome]